MFWTRHMPLVDRSTFGSQLDMFDRFFSTVERNGGTSFPPFNIWSDEDGAIITSELPGVKLENIEITVSGKSIVVKGARSEEEAGENVRSVRRERATGEFERNFKLGFQVDAAKVEAKLANGVLEIQLPRAENDKPHKIAVSAG